LAAFVAGCALVHRPMQAKKSLTWLVIARERRAGARLAHRFRDCGAAGHRRTCPTPRPSTPYPSGGVIMDLSRPREPGGRAGLGRRRCAADRTICSCRRKLDGGGSAGRLLGVPGVVGRTGFEFGARAAGASFTLINLRGLKENGQPAEWRFRFTCSCSRTCPCWPMAQLLPWLDGPGSSSLTPHLPHNR